MTLGLCYQQIAARAAAGGLVFPTSAQLALKLRALLQDPDCAVEEVVKLAAADPLLSARIVAMANSVAYSRAGQLSMDVRMAVMRLGFKTVRILATALIAQQIAAQGTLSVVQERAAQLWTHTAHVASLCHLLARQVTLVDPETAMFAGVMHEIGGFYLLACAKDFPEVLATNWQEWLATGQQQVGLAVLSILDTPADVVEAIKVYWDGYLTLPPQSLGDTLILADYLAPVLSPLSAIGTRKHQEDRPADLDILIGKEMLTSILETSAAEVASLSSALTGTA